MFPWWAEATTCPTPVPIIVIIIIIIIIIITIVIIIIVVVAVTSQPYMYCNILFPTNKCCMIAAKRA